MKKIIYSTLDANAITEYRVQDLAVGSIVNKTQDRHYFQFLFLNQKVKSHPYPADFSRIILKELGLKQVNIQSTVELDQFIFRYRHELFSKAKPSRLHKSYISSFFARYQRCFEKAKGFPIMVISDADDVKHLSEDYTHEMIGDKHCYSLLDNKQTHKVFNSYKTKGERKMIKLVYNTEKNTQLTFNVESAQQIASILHMKEDVHYYEFLLKNQNTGKSRINQFLVEYLLNELGMDYVECPHSSDLDFALIGKAEQLFDLAKENYKIKRYLDFNFRLLHQSFINTVLKPLMVISNRNNCIGLPDTFIHSEINQQVCYYDSRISQKDVNSIFNHIMAV